MLIKRQQSCLPSPHWLLSRGGEMMPTEKQPSVAPVVPSVPRTRVPEVHRWWALTCAHEQDSAPQDGYRSVLTSTEPPLVPPYLCGPGSLPGAEALKPLTFQGSMMSCHGKGGWLCPLGVAQAEGSWSPAELSETAEFMGPAAAHPFPSSQTTPHLP